MPQITLRDWKLSASVEDTDILKLTIEATDGSDIIEVAYTGEAPGRESEPYILRFTTERMEAVHEARTRRTSAGETSGGDADDEVGPGWEVDDEETIYTRGWEINALVDEDGVLAVEVVRQDDAEIYAVEPVESGIPQSSPLVVRLAAEEEIEDEDKEDEDEEEEDLEDVDDFDELNELDELDRYDDLEEGGDDLDYDDDDLFEDANQY